jgi:tape measure domain-containing protein
MTMISQYYAEVGVGLDMKSLRSTQAYLKRIERMMLQFKSRIEKQQSVTFRVNIDRASMLKQLQISANRISNAVVIPLKRFQVNEKSLISAMNKVANSVKFSKQVSFNAKLSGKSLNAMRGQIRSSLEGMVIRPRINPVMVRGGRGATGNGSNVTHAAGRTRNVNTNPLHNPMMIGGGAGAFMRYGAFSLPFVGGVVGLNALNNFASTQMAQKTALDMTASMSDTGVTAEQHREFLRSLAQSTGKTSMGMQPIYTQMLAASQGTTLEPQMADMFSGIMQYASVMGLGEESIKRAMTGFQQMIGKRQIMAEELKGQVGEHIPTVIPLMAKAMGVEVKELFKMMEQGQLDPMTALPKLAAVMRAMSAPQMAEFQKSLPYRQGVQQENRQLWLQDFNNAGGTEGLTRFWKVMGQIIDDSIGSAKTLGALFNDAAQSFSNALLVPQEFVRWIKGETDQRNIWQRMFGDSETNSGLVSTMNSLNTIKEALMSIVTLADAANNLIPGGNKNNQDANNAQLKREAAYAYGVVTEGGTALIGAGVQGLMGDFGGMRKTWGNWQDRSRNLGVEYDAKGYADRYMTEKYGSDRDKWPDNREYESRYNGYVQRNMVGSTSSAGTVPSNSLPSVMDGARNSSGGNITIIDQSRTELTVSGMAVENAQAIQDMIKAENEKRINRLLLDATPAFLRIPQ